MAGVRLLVDGEPLAAGAAATRAAVERWSRGQHSTAFADEFNPGVIDMAKYDAFIAALGPGAKAVLRGRPLALEARALGIGSSAPSSAAGFKAPLVLTVVAEHTDSVTARAGFAVDCELARRRAAAAGAMTREAEAEVVAAQAKRESGTSARVRRWAVARVWEENAEAAAGCAPGDAALAADLVAARKAADAAVMLGGRLG